MISVYLLLDLCPSPFPSLCLFLPPALSLPRPRLRPGPASRPSPILRHPRPFPLPRPPRRRNGAKVSPGRAARHRWAADSGRSVSRACGAAPLGYGNERKCCPGVLRGTVGRRIVAEMFPERATRHRWATERGRSVPRACAAAPLGDGIGRKCRPGVRRGAVRRRNGAEMSPERVVMPLWATETGGSVP